MSDKNKSFLTGSVLNNPVLFQCVGICTAVAGTSALKDAFFISVVLAADLIVCCFIASAFLKKVPRYIRIAVYLVIGLAGICCPVLWFIENRTFIELSLGMKIILPLTAVNSVTAVHCETYAVKHDVRSAVNDALSAALGTSAVLIICGIIREIIGSGSIAGTKLSSFRISGFAMPFGCLILLGFFASFLKLIFRTPSRRKPDTAHAERQPLETDIGVETEEIPEQVELNIADYDDIDRILSSTDEFLKSLTGGGGDSE